MSPPPRPSKASGTPWPPPGPPSPSSSSSRPAPRPAGRPRLPPHPGAGNAAVGARVHGAGRSPRGRFPPPPQPPPPLTPGTRPGPRGRHRVTQPGAGRGEGRRAPAARSAGDPAMAAEGPGPSVPECSVALGTLPPSAPQPARVGDRNRLPTWRTGSGPARRREHSSLAGSESGPGAPASGEASRRDSRVRRPEGAFRGEMTRGEKGSQPPPPDSKPQGHRWAWVAGEGGRFLNSALSPAPRCLQEGLATPPEPGFTRPAGITYTSREFFFFFLRAAEFDPFLGPPTFRQLRGRRRGGGKKNKVVDFQSRP